MINPFLIGTRLYLRPLENGDAATLAAYLNDPEVMSTLHRSHPLSVKAEQAFIDGLAQSQETLTLGTVLKENDYLIGVVGLHQFDWVNRHAGFGITIGARKEWGKGHGTEATALIVEHAFTTLNLNRVWLHVMAENERGIRAYRHVGFQTEGTLRQALFRGGRYHDLLTMAILQGDWAAKR